MSAILSTDDLNDFISPGVACIKPIETLPAAPAPDPDAEISVLREDTITPSSLPPAQISLTDCLACSGCVTSAEAVLVSLQSHSEVLSVLDEAPALRLTNNNTASTGLGIEGAEGEGRILVASVSPQTRASIAATYGISERQAGGLIEQFLSGERGLRSGGKWGNGFEWVLDTNVAREVCLELGVEEVVKVLGEGGGKVANETDGSANTQPTKPVLTSSCPGWICYAEKTHPHVLPHLSRLKSPQALMGTLLKTTLSRRLGVSPDRIWHVAIMPCFDKKLEASREELTDAYWGGQSTSKRGVRDVDCVITSKELLMLADSRGIDLRTLPRTTLCSSYRTTFPDATLSKFLFPRPRRRESQERAAGTSGGNLYHILKYFASQTPGARIESSKGRNADVVEYTVVSASGEPLLKAARYYGFRNIQNLVRRLKPAKASRLPGGRPVGAARRPNGKPAGPEHAYIEVMACPGGCTNGGGQIKVDDPVISERWRSDMKPGPQEQKEWLAQVDEAYFSADDEEILSGLKQSDESQDEPGVKDTLAYWSASVGLELDRLAYTSYRAVVSDVGKKVGETQRVAELAGKAGGGW